MFENVQMTSAVPNILLSVCLLIFVTARINFFLLRGGSQVKRVTANCGSIATN